MRASIRNEHKDEVKADYADASVIGINGTPLFVNGNVLAGAHPFSAFEKVIEELLAQASAGSSSTMGR